VFDHTPVDEGRIRELAGGDFSEAKRNLIVIGGAEPDSWYSPRHLIESPWGASADLQTADVAANAFFAWLPR